jgi:hypothetical protein
LIYTTCPAITYDALEPVLILSPIQSLIQLQILHLLSENPNLTPQEVFNTLTNTADKIGGYTYTDGRCNQTGFGRVNAFNALQALCTTTNFVNQTVTTNTTVEDCNVNVQNVDVTNNSKLTIEAENEVIINGEFEVELGSELEIK